MTAKLERLLSKVEPKLRKELEEAIAEEVQAAQAQGRRSQQSAQFSSRAYRNAAGGRDMG